MKKLILLCFLFCFCACNEEDSKTVIAGDMMYFAEVPVIPEEGGVYIDPVTSKTIETATTRSWEFWATRGGSQYLPKAEAIVVINQTLSTAKAGVDFNLIGANVVFDGEDNWRQNVRLDILAEHLTEPKTLILRLVYGYEDLCPLRYRALDVLTITLQ